MRTAKKRKTIRNKISKTVLFTAVLAMLAAMEASASVSFTKEAAGPAGSVYVAGNPDLYPLESYNGVTGEYEGVMTELIREVSVRTGYDFVYVASSSANHQARMGKNLQAEVLTAYTGELGDWCKNEAKTITFTKDGKQVEARICLTSVLPSEKEKQIEKALCEISDSQINEWTVSYTMEKQRGSLQLTMIVVPVLLLILAAVLFFFAFRNYRKLQQAKEVRTWLDPLTGKGNRRYFEDRFHEMVTDEARPSCYLIYYFFDINWVNRCIGREAAEELLKAIAGAFPEDTEKRIVCRTHGGAFANLIEADSTEAAKKEASEKLEILNEAAKNIAGVAGFRVQAVVVPLGKIMGDAPTVLQYASDIADGAKAPVTVCDESVWSRIAENKELLGHIGQAFEKSEFQPLIQPIFDVQSGRLCMGEVLVRWENPVFGRLKPGRFLPIVQEAGELQRFDLYMLEKTCELLQRWKGSGCETVGLACNVSRDTLSGGSFPELLSGIVEKYSFDHSLLYIEMTEEMMEKSREAVEKNILELRRQGFKVVLDDLGTGYTSFMNLYSYTFDAVKLDRDLVPAMKTEKGMKLISGIIELAHRISCKVIFEGIESEEQRNEACQCGCDYIQGFFYARPMTPEDALKKIQNS